MTNQVQKTEDGYISAFIKDIQGKLTTGNSLIYVENESPLEAARWSASCAFAAFDDAEVFYWTPSLNNWVTIPDVHTDITEILALTHEDGKKGIDRFYTKMPNDNYSPRKNDNVVKFIYTPKNQFSGTPVFIINLLTETAAKQDNPVYADSFHSINQLMQIRPDGWHCGSVILIGGQNDTIKGNFENLFSVVKVGRPTYNDLSDIYDNEVIGGLIDESIASRAPSDAIRDGCFNNMKQKMLDAKEDIILGAQGLSRKTFMDLIIEGISNYKVFEDIIYKPEGEDSETKETFITDINVGAIVSHIRAHRLKVIDNTPGLSLLNPVSMDKVGGLDLLKDWLYSRKQALTPEAEAFGISKPKGVLLIGPPGTGKSYIASAFGDLLGRQTIKFDIADVFDKFVGGSEHAMQNALDTIDFLSPCVLLVDEIDKIFGNNGMHETSSKVLSKFLSWLQDHKKDIFLVMTANRIGNIPAELLRRGRTDECFYVGLPNGRDRESIMKVHTGNNDLSLDSAVKATEGFSAAEMQHVVNEAKISAFINGEPLTDDRIAYTASGMRPMSIAFADDVAAMAAWAKSNAKPSSRDDEIIDLDVRPRAKAKTSSIRI